MKQLVHTSRAPVRVDPAGGGTDCPPFCVEYGGAVVNFGIQLFAHARLVVHPDNPAALIRSMDFGTEVKAANAQELPLDGRLDLLVAIARRMAPNWGFELTVESEVPPGCGLGSSAAVSVACVSAFDAALGEKRSSRELGALANEIERVDLGAPGGSQDSYGAALGGVNYLVYQKGGSLDIEQLALPDQVVWELERRCVLVYTGEAHLSGSIHDDIKRSYALPNSPTIDAMRHLADIAHRSAVALRDGNLDAFGSLLNENRVHHYRLHESCDSARLREFYDAVEGDIVGGKTCGAGGGGCILFLAKEGRRRAVETACAKLGGQLMTFRLDRLGVQAWQSNAV
jgi:D-glycero-alpha-D-manno-heptose-7-phosphate kinase